MKKILYISIISWFTFSITSCEKFLDRAPENLELADTTIKSDFELQALLNGCYNNYAMNIAGGKIQWIADLMADQAIGVLFTGDDGEIFGRKTSIFGDYKNGTYDQIYSIINNANRALQSIDVATTTRDHIEGQAKFIRALAHYTLVNLWAQPWGYTSDNSHYGVVLMTESNLNPGQRSTVAQVYAQIENDLLSAIQLLNATTEMGFANKDAARALLAKVYFTQHRAQDAFNYASEVIDNPVYQLDADYESKYSLDGSTEIIFGFKNISGAFEPGGEFRGRYRSDIGFNPQSRFYFSNVLYNAMNSGGSVRGAAWTSNSLVAGYNVLTKFNGNFFDLPVIGLVEMKLIRAEAGARVGGTALATAIEDINEIMTRAYGGTGMNLAPNTPAATVINATRRERQYEMIGEGDRLYEIKRIGSLTGTSIDGRGAPWNCPGMILQFPQGEKAAYTPFVMNQEGGCN
ncbi:RagB/SusD family nutrient uptake outer membrane protein [Gynurincola endophyticus]|uniref:RagB/SusD family nutrient uptake outer membrane protein n=1 Tax=Gynurincola endophyticus TaxID=2479004 RepID=UPI000F8C6CC3|nr:RagB/SusD family nutrient uptake outer membrane protein [Gynurincola endophyticus]